jgi:hypothetical protein
LPVQCCADCVASASQIRSLTFFGEGDGDKLRLSLIGPEKTV